MGFDAQTPIYLQIACTIRRLIVSGRWAPGTKTPAVRELALEMGVNPNTMQRAMALLEDEGLLHTERTSGRFVTTDPAVVDQARRTMTEAEIENFLAAMAEIGYGNEEIFDLVARYGEKKR